MANIFTVKLLKNGQLIQQRQVHTGLAESTGAVRIKAQTDTVYVLSAEAAKKSVAKILTQRVGNDLHVVLDDSTSGKPQLIIEGYFEPNQNAALATQGSEGELVLFSAQNQQVLQNATDANAFEVQIADGADASWWHAPGTQLALIAGGVWAISSAKNKSSDSANPAQDSIVAYATGAAQATPPTEALYKDAGYTGVTANNLGAINSALQRTHTKDSTGIQKIITTYQKLIDKANGSTADTTTNDPTLSDYQTLGVVLLSIDSTSNSNSLGLLNDIVKSRNLADVNTVSKLDGFASIVDKIMLLAKGDVPPSPLTTAELNSIGLNDVTDANVAAIRSAIVASNDDGTGVTSVTQLKNIQTTYLKVLAQADGVKGNATVVLTKMDYSLLGALANFDENTGAPGGGTYSAKAGNDSSPQKVAALSLLNDVIDARTATQVDSIAEINLLSVAVDKVVEQANTSPATTLKLSDFSLLGIQNVTDMNLSQVIRNLHTAADSQTDGHTIDTLAEIQSSVSLAVVQLFADNGNVTPGLQVYNDLSFSDVSWSNALVSAVNSVVDNKTKADITLDSLHSIANAYENILNEATNSISNSNPDPTLADYETVTGSHLHVFTVGSNVEPTLAANALALMNQVVLHKTANALSTQLAVETLATQVDSLMHLASGTGSITFSALASMGFDIPSGWSDVNTPNKIKEFARLVDVSANSGADINTWDKVNDLIHAASVIAA